VVHLVEVDVVDLQPPQARLAGAADVVGGQSAVVRAQPHRLVHLGRQDDVVAVPAAPQPPADGLLGDAVPLAMSGDCGPPYTSAVSMRLMPASIAAFRTAKLVGSSTVQPKFIVPSAIRLTTRPDRPKCRYAISPLTPGSLGPNPL
jgi:hypothetical protein